MTAQSIVCGACAAEVPNGRLSCPSCGELLASVAGSRRVTAPVAASIAASKAVPKVLYDPAEAPSASVVDGQLSLEASERDTKAELPGPDVTHTHPAGDAAATVADGDDRGGLFDDDDAGGLPAWTPPASTVPWGTASDLNGGRTPAYMPRPGLRPSAPQQPPSSEADPFPPDDAPGWDPAPAPARAAQPDVSWQDPSSVAWPPRESVAWPGSGAAAAALAAAAQAPVPDVKGAAATPAPVVPAPQPAPAPQPIQAFAGPGAYLPPPPVAIPAGPSAPAREWAGHAGAGEATEGEAAARSRAAMDGDLRVRLLDFVRWLSVAGSAFAAVGFLLPWGQVVIGSADTGYFGRWGIAGPWHLLVALAILADLGLALIDNKIPVWIRTGITGLGLGALLLGLVWPYLTLPSLGAGPGAVIAAIGAAGLVVSGILALVADRHAEAPRPV
jgi:hypothetical protein